jgi:hypothetical protein
LILCFIFVALHSWMICWAILLGEFDITRESCNSSDGGFEEFRDVVEEENLMRDIAEIY